MITGGGTSGGTSVAAVAFGTAAARPAAAAGNSGTAYYATDTGEITFSNGTAWSAIAGTSDTTFQVALGAASGGTLAFAGGVNLASQAGGGTGVVVGNGIVQLNPQYDMNAGRNVSAGGYIDSGAGFRTKEIANGKQGTAILVAGSAVVANTSVTATSRIFLTSQVDGGAPGFLRVSTRTAGTSFTITSSSGTDTSTVAWEIFEVG